ncbi:MAG: hypothetical protein E6I38_04385 [Chloroflexi bacterium]|nr:MAG: hypothetical protein E6I38_04385 [Chloroflexota bacterium]
MFDASPCAPLDAPPFEPPPFEPLPPFDAPPFERSLGGLPLSGGWPPLPCRSLPLSGCSVSAGLPSGALLPGGFVHFRTSGTDRIHPNSFTGSKPI